MKTIGYSEATQIFSTSNKVYKIYNNIDLSGNTLTIPSGCTLDFQGGVISNGTIVGNDTVCLTEQSKLPFSGITRIGTWESDTFVDKPYSANTQNGMGRIVLRKNIVNGVNTLTQSMMSDTNTVYVIRYDFTLGEDVTVPTNCVLNLQGGSISGTNAINGTNTILINNGGSISATKGGTWTDAQTNSIDGLYNGGEAAYDSQLMNSSLLDMVTKLAAQAEDDDVLLHVTNIEKMMDDNDNISPIFIPAMELYPLEINNSAEYGNLLFDVVSSTQNSFTLNTEDKNSLIENASGSVGDGLLCVVCRFGPVQYSDEDDYFDSSQFFRQIVKLGSGNTFVIDASEENPANLTNVRQVGIIPLNSQHLTRVGSKCLAQYICNNVTSKYGTIEKNLVGGFISWKSSNAKIVSYNATAINNGKEVINLNFSTPYTLNGYQSTAIISLSGFLFYPKSHQFQNLYCVWRTADSSPKDQWLEIPINMGKKNQGYLEIEVCGYSTCHIGSTYQDSDGEVRMEVYVDDNATAIYSEILPRYFNRIILDNLNCKDIRVRFIHTENKLSGFVVNHINFYRKPSSSPVPVSLQNKKVAYLGDSWGQFHNGILPKEIANFSGCAFCDNYSKGGQTAVWGLTAIDEVLSKKKYDYVIIQFFVNDINQNYTPSQLAENLKKICYKCMTAGARPIVVMPCLNHRYGNHYEYLTGGFKQ